MDHISEWKLDLNTKDINIFMYSYINNNGVCLEMNELYKICKNFNKLNKINNICGDLLCSWEDINLDSIYVKEKQSDDNIIIKDVYTLIKEKTCIDFKIEKHRLLLKGLILKSIRHISIISNYWNYLGCNKYIKKESLSKQNSVEIYEKMNYDCNIDLNGSIYIGFILSYQIISQESLKNRIIKGHKIEKGDYFIYKQNGQRIKYLKTYKKNIKQYIINNKTKETLYDYLDKKGFVETYNIDPDSITILGSSSNIYNYKIKEELKYAPEMLFLIKSEYRLSYLFNVGGNNIQIKNSIEYSKYIINKIEEMFVKKKLIMNPHHILLFIEMVL